MNVTADGFLRSVQFEIFTIRSGSYYNENYTNSVIYAKKVVLFVYQLIHF